MLGALRLLCLAALAVALAGPAAAERRVALVIGNGAYKIGPLANPGNDAEAVAAALKELGFEEVLLRRDLGYEGMRRALREFAPKASGADIAVFYFAGHGTEQSGRNFLLPVDATLARASDLDVEAIPLDTVLSQIGGALKLRLVILDACRNSLFPLAGHKRSTSRGLARVEPDENTLVAYAAKEGTLAEDGTGRHSPFTAALLKHLATPGLEIDYVFRLVRDDVLAATGRAQQPHTYGTLGRERIILKAAAAAPVAAPARTDDDVADLLAAVGGMSDRERLAAFARHRNPAVAKAAAERLAALAPVPLPTPGPAPAAPAVPPAPADPVASLVPGSGQSARDCPECPEMVVVPSGSFMMGSPASEAGRDSNEGPQRKVTIARPFAVGKFEVTFDEWAACVTGGGCASNKSPSDYGWGKGRRPVIDVSWDDTQAYVAWLSRKTGKAYRLLTEAEWEYAARGVASASARHTRFHFGDSDGALGEHAWFSGNSGSRTHEVGQKRPNAWGLHDMHGNVWEWVEDCWHDNYSSAPMDGSAAAGLSTCVRVLRGGSGVIDPGGLRAAFRHGGRPGNRFFLGGFRVGRSAGVPARTF